VLVVDDQQSYREAIARLLRGAGYRVLLASNGDEAVSTCRRESPDAIVLDLVMPGTDGLAACRALRADHAVPHVPIMFVSQVDNKVEGLRAGAEDYLSKPYDDEELIARVEALVRTKRLIDGPRPRSKRDTAPGIPEQIMARDPLTGAWTYAYLKDRAESEIQRATRHNEPLSLMVIDVEQPAELIESHGQRLQDQILIAAAGGITRCTRAIDVVCRGEDATFAVLLPKTHFAGAVAAADRIWRELSHTDLSLGGDPKLPAEVTLRASIGVACYPTLEVKSATELLAFATSALSRARAEGPAHICLYQHQAYIFQPED
jgi:diguanylate cyclase (GGDEF)-like protein